MGRALLPTLACRDMVDGTSVSVVVLVHDRTDYVSQAIESIVRGAPAEIPLEIVLVKHHLLPHIGAAEELCDRVIDSHSEGLGGKLAEGVRASSGEIVCFLEDDDLFLPQKILSVARAFRDPQLLCYNHARRLIDEAGASIPETIDQIGRRRPSDPWKVESGFRRLFFSPTFVPNVSSICLKRQFAEVFANVLERTVGVEFLDCAMILFAAKLGSVLLDPTPLSCYRVHRGTVQQIGLEFDDFVRSYARFLSNSIKNLELFASEMPDERRLWRLRTSAYKVALQAIQGGSRIACGEDYIGSLAFAALSHNSRMRVGALLAVMAATLSRIPLPLRRGVPRVFFRLYGRAL